jgi:DNA-binding response OmpR family regulator
MTHEPDVLSMNHRPHVLLVEDDPDQSDMLREALEDEGYHVDTAFSGDVAIRKLLSHDYVLVLLDIRMPGLDGVSVLRRYRSEKQGAQAPIIVVSAFATDADVAMYIQAGANAGIAKPYDLKHLLTTIANLAGVPENGKP